MASSTNKVVINKKTNKKTAPKRDQVSNVAPKKIVLKKTKKGKKRILIAEDERPMARALALKLGFEGYEVVNVYDGKTALETVKKEDFDIVLLDIMMPLLNGFDVLVGLTDHFKKEMPPVLVLSNLSQEEDAEKAKELGAVDFIIKSNTPISDVVSIIKKYV